MAKPRSPWMDYALYFVSRVVVCVLQSVSPRLALSLMETLLALVFRFDRRHREATIDNLRHAFPGQYSDAELHALALNTYRHFGSMILEMILMTRKLTAGSCHRFVDGAEYPRLRAMIDSGRPVILLTAHYGNWELAAHWLGLVGLRSTLVGRPLDNPHLDRWLQSLRKWTGHKVVSKTGDIRQMIEVLAAKETLCTLADQDAGPRGMFVEFFGRPASTHKAIARMAERTGAVIAVVGMQKIGGLLEYKWRVMDMIRPEDYADHAEATHAITQRFTAAVEQMVRLDPVQYFWLHRRWKHQPATVEVKKAA